MNDKARFFQWITGERRGEVVIFDKIVQEDGIIFISFKDNSRINANLVAEINVTDLTNKMMAEVENSRNIWRFKEKPAVDESRIEQDWQTQVKYEVPSADDIAHADLTNPEGGVVQPKKRKKAIKLIPPIKTRNKFGRIASTDDLAASYNESIKTELKIQSATPVEPSMDHNDPVYIMMNKAKKKDIEVSMTLTISLPSKALFDVAVESFDKGGDKVIEYILNNMDIKEIKESLKIALKNTYIGEENIEDKTFYVPETIAEPIITEPKSGGDFEELKQEIAEQSIKLNITNE
jgi:hypothetical protein